ncbi:MAG: response regulator [Leptolyngbyaceae cyanobacterium HOT.MB2.61]|nr:response regulator [Leptolyngbyaceae cyanobacterium HOT.MB2.61]
MKILVVEDDELTAEALVAALSNQNYTVEVASDGEAGWELAEAFTYDLILLDVTLPRLDGIHLCQRLRSHGFQMPILLLTARNSSHDKAIGLDAGADDYVVKPFEPEELAARIRALLRRNQATVQSVLEWGNLRLDPKSCEVTYGAQPVSLTAKEYALLELFLRNSRRVFSCGAILENLWSFEDVPSDEAVRTHIKGLRQKLKAAGAPANLIETVYGIGYRLKPLEAEKGEGTRNKEKQVIEQNAPQASSKSAKLSAEQVGQQTWTAIAEVWQRFQPRVSEQITVLEQAVTALSDQSLSQELRQQAKQEAHTLAGSLGTFGFEQASQLAGTIEQQFQSCDRLNPNQIHHLQQLIRMLRQQIEHPGKQSASPLQTPQKAQTSDQMINAKVMIVDDDPQLLATLRTLLEPWGFHVTTLDNPNSFWTVLETTAPDLLILDLKMPNISGIELCQNVRNHERWNSLPIVVLTAYSDANTVNQVFAVGADDFISKPIAGPELITRIVNRLERIKLLKNLAMRCQNEVTERQNAEIALRKVKDELEMRVAERTAELVSINERLRSELNERVQIEEALRVSQARFAGILDIADDAIISTDGRQRITLFNRGAEKIFGYTVQEAIGQPLDLLLPVRFVEVHRQHVKDFGQSSSEARRMGERREIFGRRKNGEEFPAEASISKLQLKEEIIYTVILRDTSDRKVIERMKDEFISIVSHELRTPLTSIHGSLAMLVSGLLDAEPETSKRLLEIAVDSTERLIRLINDVLDVERIESGKVTMDKQTCNVADLMTNAVNVMQTMAEKFGVTLSVTPLSIEVWADSDRIIQTLTNLLSNAIKFSPQGATVWLSATQQGDYILFQVKDLGRGIPADKLETIFERFQQVDASDSRNQDGTGLGLAICRNIVQQHGGRIWVESALGEGSTFYFTLPLGEGGGDRVYSSTQVH